MLDELIDFTLCDVTKKTFGGANGNKISVIYKNERYMLKFPQHADKNKNIYYANSCISEYLGCHIFNMLGVEAQNTKLGYYTISNNKKIVVACKDITSIYENIQDFASLKNQIIESMREGRGTELNDILETIEEQKIIDKEVLLERFWQMFAIDSLIGNWDRHNGNWGFIYNSFDDSIRLSPVFDCGSALYPQLDEQMMEKMLNNRNELNLRIYERPTSAIKFNDKRINYYDFLINTDNKDCIRNLKLIRDRIDFNKINKLIEQTPTISEVSKGFYKTILKERLDKIIDKSLKEHSKQVYISEKNIIPSINPNLGKSR